MFNSNYVRLGGAVPFDNECYKNSDNICTNVFYPAYLTPVNHCNCCNLHKQGFINQQANFQYTGCKECSCFASNIIPEPAVPLYSHANKSTCNNNLFQFQDLKLSEKGSNSEASSVYSWLDNLIAEARAEISQDLESKEHFLSGCSTDMRSSSFSGTSYFSNSESLSPASISSTSSEILCSCKATSQSDGSSDESSKAAISLEELTKKKRHQNRMASARYRRKIRDRRLLEKEEMSRLERRNAQLRVDIGLLQQQVKEVKQLIMSCLSK